MRESHWRATSLVLTTAMIILVASWASAQSRAKSEPQDDQETVVLDSSPTTQIVVERDRKRYVLTRGYAMANETDKYFLYDSWDVAETKDIWVLKDPHRVKSSWKRMSFDK